MRKALIPLFAVLALFVGACGGKAQPKHDTHRTQVYTVQSTHKHYVRTYDNSSNLFLWWLILSTNNNTAYQYQQVSTPPVSSTLAPVAQQSVGVSSSGKPEGVPEKTNAEDVVDDEDTTADEAESNEQSAEEIDNAADEQDNSSEDDSGSDDSGGGDSGGGDSGGGGDF